MKAELKSATFIWFKKISTNNNYKVPMNIFVFYVSKYILSRKETPTSPAPAALPEPINKYKR